jgi:hypothetical protein
MYVASSHAAGTARQTIPLCSSRLTDPVFDWHRLWLQLAEVGKCCGECSCSLHFTKHAHNEIPVRVPARYRGSDPPHFGPFHSGGRDDH